MRVFTGTDRRGRPTQLSRTVHGGKRDASELETGKGRGRPAGRFVGDVLDASVKQNFETDDSDEMPGAHATVHATECRGRYPK